MHHKRISNEELMKMRWTINTLIGFMMIALSCGQAGAWAHANHYGGSTAHTHGAKSHTNAYGGSTTHAYGEGTEHTNAYGGSTAHGWDGGTEHTNVYGGTTAGAEGGGGANAA